MGSVNDEHSFQVIKSAHIIKFLIRKGLPTDDKEWSEAAPINTREDTPFLWFNLTTILIIYYEVLWTKARRGCMSWAALEKHISLGLTAHFVLRGSDVLTSRWSSIMHLKSRSSMNKRFLSQHPQTIGKKRVQTTLTNPHNYYNWIFFKEIINVLAPPSCPAWVEIEQTVSEDR